MSNDYDFTQQGLRAQLVQQCGFLPIKEHGLVKIVNNVAYRVKLRMRGYGYCTFKLEQLSPIAKGWVETAAHAGKNRCEDDVQSYFNYLNTLLK